VHRAGTVRFLPDNTTIDTQLMDKITFRDGKAVEYFQFADTYLLARTAGAPDSRETLRKFYDARNRADLEEQLSYLHPRCVFRIVGHPGLGSFTEVADTPEKIRAAAAVLFEAWDLSGLETVDSHRSGDTVFVHRKGQVRFIPADIPFETELMDKFTFKDGLIIELLQFVDTHIVTLVLAKAGAAVR
jgi:ketosteroid isomerase-like protein